MRPGLEPPTTEIEQYLSAARRGSQEALGRLFELCRPYLLLVANQELSPELRAKLGGSDLVQDTFLEAQRDFTSFAGDNAYVLLAWLRRMLLNNLANTTRHYVLAGKRSVGRELALGDSSAEGLRHSVAGPGPSPSSALIAEEQGAALQRALERLSEVQRQVVQWRNYERLSFEEIGHRLGRSAEAARKLWGRAVEQLNDLLERPDEPG